MERRKYIASAGAAATALLAGCGGNGGSGNGNGGGDGNSGSGEIAATFVMEGSTFKEEVKEVPVGSTVKWENKDSSVFAHTIKSDTFTENAVEWDLSETVSEGGSFTHTFDEAGVYEFYSQNVGKDQMCGAVVVGDATLSGTLPCQE